MLINNNPDIDFESLNARIKSQLDDYEAAENHITPPSFDEQQKAEPKVFSLEELLTLEDEAFIEYAYQLILNRQADHEGLDHYLHLLRTGTDKTRIIGILCSSAEGQANAHLFPGYRKEVLKRRLTKLPVVGTLFKILLPLLTVGPFRQHVNASFNHFHRVTGAYSAQQHENEIRIQALIDDQLAQRKRLTAYQEQLLDKIYAQDARINAQAAVITELEEKLESFMKKRSGDQGNHE